MIGGLHVEHDVDPPQVPLLPYPQVVVGDRLDRRARMGHVGRRGAAPSAAARWDASVRVG